MKNSSSKLLSSVAVGAAAFAVVLAALPSGSARANPRRILIFPGQRSRPAPVVRTLLRPRGNVASPAPCTEQFGEGYSFVGVTMGGNVAGGDDTAILGGNSNDACDEYAGVGVGLFNTVAGAGDATYSFVAGGAYNGILGGESFIGAGNHGIVSGNGSFIGAGDFEYSQGGGSTPGNQVSGSDSFIGAGDENIVSANEAFVGSGLANSIGSAATYSTILGGARNVISGEYSSVLGGYGNTAGGEYAIVAGGNTSSATGELSFAAGYHADAVHSGSFVWSDFGSGSALLKDTASNQFVVRASGGASLYSNETMTSGVKLAAGSGTWAALSDRNAKTDVAALDDDSVLAKVGSLPVSTWRYTSESGVRHVGPMAQDFYAAFGVGEDDRHITSIDEDGVALAAIKALRADSLRKGAEIVALRAELDHVEAILAARH
jgi:trimeric autotransporter adhesin